MKIVKRSPELMKKLSNLDYICPDDGKEFTSLFSAKTHATIIFRNEKTSDILIVDNGDGTYFVTYR